MEPVGRDGHVWQLDERMMSLPSYYTHEGLPNPYYFNAIYARLGMAVRVQPDDLFHEEDVTRIYRALGMDERASASWADDRALIEAVLRKRGLI